MREKNEGPIVFCILPKQSAPNTYPAASSFRPYACSTCGKN